MRALLRLTGAPAVPERGHPGLPSIDALLPHRAPMQLIDRVLAADAEGLWAEASTDRRTALKDAAGVPAVAALEMLAQSSAAYFTLRAHAAATADSTAASSAPVAGMLVACRALNCRQSHWPSGHRLVLRVQVLAGAAGAASGGGLVRFAGLLWLAQHEDSSSAWGPQQAGLRATALSQRYDPAAAAAEGEFSVYIPPPGPRS